jgi:hypothetical protein
MATTIGAARGPATGDYRRDPRSRLPARASTAGERRGDVVQRSIEAYLLFARAASELIPGRAEHLKRLLQAREGVAHRRVAGRLFGSGLEAPGGLDDVGRPVVELTWAIHAAIVVAPRLADHGAQCPKRPAPVPIRSVTWMEARSRINAQNDALPLPCAPATINGRPTNGPNTATRWITQIGADGNMTSHHDSQTTPDGPFASRPRRFSEGIERMPRAPSSSRVGRFSDGLARSPRSASAKRIGSFADGVAQRPYDRSARRVGSFGDGYERGGGGRETAPRVGSPRNTEGGRLAA